MIDLTHDELAHSLAIHLKNDSRMVWENIPAGMAGEVRPDVYTIQKSFMNPNPITYEIKISLSDFRSDVTSAKWKNYLRFSYGVVFAAPKGLLSRNDVPKQCGLIVCNGEGLWHTLKKPTLNPCKIDSDLLLKLLMDGAERMTVQKPILNRDFDQWTHMDKLRKKFGKDISEKLSFIEDYPKMKKEITSLKKELSDLFNIKPERWNFLQEIRYKIDDLKVMNDEKARKKKIAGELLDLNNNLSRRINHIIGEYTK